MKILLAVLAILVASPAFAVDPECVDAVGDQPVYSGCQLKTGARTAQFTFCSPQFDDEGDPIPEQGSLASCTVTLDGLPEAIANVDRPGQVFVINLESKNPGHIIGAYCTNTDGEDGEDWLSDICFPSGRPKAPQKR
jgi:hypothetical protein